MENLTALPLEDLCELAQQYEVIDECVFSDAEVTIQIGDTRVTLAYDDARSYTQGLVHGHIRTVETLPLWLIPSTN